MGGKELREVLRESPLAPLIKGGENPPGPAWQEGGEIALCLLGKGEVVDHGRGRGFGVYCGNPPRPPLLRGEKILPALLGKRGEKSFFWRVR
jgi:hypothetical protein